MNLMNLDERLDKIEKLLLFKKKVLNISEVSDITGYSKSYLYKLTHLKDIPHSKPKGKLVFFDREKIETWMLQNEVKTKDQIDSDALAYTLNKKR